MSARLFIFLAEDNPGDVLLAREALEQAGLKFELIVAKDGDEARAYLDGVGDDAPCADVMLLDLNLPRIEGPGLIELVRGHPGCAQAPIIVVTSSDAPKDRAWTGNYGIAHYFRKPSNYEAYMKLGEIVRAVAERTAFRGAQKKQ